MLPKERRRPTQPNEMAVHEIEGILAEAIARPTLGAGRLLEHLAERDIQRSKSGVQKILTRHGLGTRASRVTALAALTAATIGIISRQAEPCGFCHFAPPPYADTVLPGCGGHVEACGDGTPANSVGA